MKEFKFKIGGTDYLATVEEIQGGNMQVTVNGQTYQVEMAQTRACGPRPVMGASGAASVLYAKDAKTLKDEGKVEEAKAYIKEKEEEYNKLFATPYQAAKFGYIDDVIEPRNTRFRVIRALAQLENKKLTNPAKKHGNIPL